MLPIQPQEATKMLLTHLPSRRMRDVIEKRFGLKGGKRYTLESIGKEYKITRERVRQIENDALKNLRKEESRQELGKLYQAIEENLSRHGGAMAEDHLFTTLAEAKFHPHLALLLTTAPQFYFSPETEFCRARWALDKEKGVALERVVGGIVHELKSRGAPVSEEELRTIVARKGEEINGSLREPRVHDAYLAATHVVKKNPYGEYGLVSWPHINPRGVRDKAYLVLSKKGEPLHFRQVAELINKTGWSKKRAHPQTVHNELIKDSRFVLVGRGLYALSEWGYQPGVVRDVMISLLKRSQSPLSKDEIVKLVLEKRFVKPQTVLLNLQNRNLFKRTGDGRYSLA